MHVLLVLASGKSSRFGGFPKAFCKINNEYIVQRTVSLGRKIFDKIYLCINKELFPKYKDIVQGCKTICIGTGQGDAHSFLRAVRMIKNDCEVDLVTVCWGDTFYLDDTIFKKAFNTVIGRDLVGVSFCSLDQKPYAWFDTDGEVITSSHFRSKEENVQEGIHDQSIFLFAVPAICLQLEQYMGILGINDEEDYINKEFSKEIKLLDAFTFFYQNHLLPMKYTIVESGLCFSFNTAEELEEIRKKLQKKASIDHKKE